MKKSLLFIIALFFQFVTFAQMPPNLPIDPKVRMGTLENGLTYYIVKNQEPIGQAEFFIMQKVGSILEEENQRGLAHFLEHMAFNGTENFPGNGIISYLETIGVKFGQNLNAGTGVEETVYNISAVPVKSEAIIDSCLLILRDWSCAISLNEDDIDKERGVIREEYRLGRSASMRMYETALPVIMPNSRHPYRLPIGTLDVIDNFSYNEIRDFYHKWYRPDLQGIMVVGDIDPDMIEAKIKTLFGAIPKHENPAPREEFPVPNNESPLISVVSDPEFPYSVTMLMYKQEPIPMELRGTTTAIAFNFMTSMINSMINSRFSEIVQKPDAPFVDASSSYGDFILARSKAAISIANVAKEGRIEEALNVVVNEIQRMKQFGFTVSEYERAKANYLSRMEQLYNEREKQKNYYYTGQIQNHFINGNAMPGIEMTYMIMSQAVPMIPLEQVNQVAKALITDNNIVILSMNPQKDGIVLPTAEELLKRYNTAVAEEVLPYEETLSDEPLISVEPAPGRIVSQSKQPLGDVTEWKLSNGSTVVIKKTDFKEDQIIMGTSSKGGYSLFDKKDIMSAQIIDDVITLGGLGNFNAIDLKKVLAGKNVSTAIGVGLSSEGFRGECPPKDLETMMQLVYLYFTALKSDHEAFQSFMNMVTTAIKNQESQPMVSFSDSLQKTLYNGSVYASRLTLEMLSGFDYDHILNLAKERFANAADFTFIFTGNVDEAQLKPLVEKYLASLPGDPNNKEESRPVDLLPVKGVVKNHFDRQMQTPMATVQCIYSGSLPYNLENVLYSNVASQILGMVFTRSLREDEQGTYSVGANMQLQHFPEDHFIINIRFSTDVPLTEKLLNRTYKEIDNIVQNGFLKEDFDKTIEFLNKQYSENLRNNEYWSTTLSTWYRDNSDMHTNRKAAIDSMTVDKLHTFFKSAINQGNLVEIIMRGKE